MRNSIAFPIAAGAFLIASALNSFAASPRVVSAARVPAAARALTLDADRNAILASGETLWVVSPAAQIVATRTLSGMDIRSIAIDRGKTIYAAGGALAVIKGDAVERISFDQSAEAVAIDRQDRVVIGGDGFVAFDRQTIATPGMRIVSIAVDDSNTVWFAAAQGGLAVLARSAFGERPAAIASLEGTPIAVTSGGGAVWFATSDGAWLWNGSSLQQRRSMQVRAIATDAKGRVYIVGGGSVTAMDGSGHVLYSDSVGGETTALGTDSLDRVYFAGITSQHLPAPAFPVVEDQGDGFLVKLSEIPVEESGQGKRNGAVVDAGRFATGCTYAITTPNSIIPGEGGTTSLQIAPSSNTCSWRVTAGVNWISVNTASGVGRGTVSFTAAPNPDAGVRTGAISVEGQTVSYVQKPAPPSVSTLGLAYDSGGGIRCKVSLNPLQAPPAPGPGKPDGQVNMSFPNDKCAWKAQPMQEEWLAMPVKEGKQKTSEEVKYAVSANQTPATRSQMVVVLQYDLDDNSLRPGTPDVRQYPIAQDAAAAICTFTLRETSVRVGAAGGSASTELVASSGSCPWTASPSDSWIAVANSSGTGGATLNLNIAANSSRNSRTGSVTVGGQQLTVLQEGMSCRITLSAASANSGAGGDSSGFDVSATPSDCSWSAQSATPWIEITGGSSGTGNGRVQFSVAANSSAGGRSSSITVADQTFTITQAGASCQYVVTPASANAAAAAGKGMLTVAATPLDCQWQPSSDSDWLTVPDRQPRNGNGSVEYEFSENRTPSPRAGKILLADKAVTVTQQGKIEVDGNASLTAEPNPITACNSDGKGRTTLRWDTAVERIRIRVGSPTGDVVTEGEGRGTFETAAIGDNTFFFLQSQSGQQLRQLQVRTACQSSGFADLELTSLTASNSAPSGAKLDNVEAKLKNSGKAVAGPFRVGFYFGRTRNVTKSDIYTGWSCSWDTLPTGEERVCSGSIGVPNLDAGQWFFAAIVDDEGKVEDSNRNNNGRVFGPIDITRDPAQSNLIESAHPYENNTDKVFEYRFSNANVPSIRVAFDAQTEVEEDYDWLVIMDANGQVVPGGIATGKELAGKTLVVPGNVVKINLWSDEDITAYGFKVTNVTAGPELADLQMTSVVAAPSALVSTAIANVRAEFRNAGKAPTGKFLVNFYLSKVEDLSKRGEGDLIDMEWGCNFEAGLDPGSNSACYGDLPIPADLPPGKYWVVANADDSNLVVENDRGNNYKMAAATQVQSTTVAFTANPNPATACDASGLGRTTLTWDAPGHARTQIGIAGTSRTFAAQGTSGSIDTGYVVTNGIVFQLTGNGGAILKTVAVQLRCPPASKPDLQVTSFRTATAVAQGGEINPFEVVVFNRGTASAGPFRVGYYISSTQEISRQSTLIYSCTWDQRLEVGGSMHCDFPVPISAEIPAGTYYLGAIVDSLNQVDESDESNNLRLAESGPIRIGQAANLVINSVDSDATSIGGTLNVDVVVGNSGQLAARNFTVVFYLSKSTTFGRDAIDMDYGCRIEALNPQATFECYGPMPVAGRVPAGTYYLYAIADRENVVLEPDKRDNVRSAPRIVTIR